MITLGPIDTRSRVRFRTCVSRTVWPHMRSEVILFYLDDAKRDLTCVFETRRLSPRVKHLLVDSSEIQLVDAYRGVQKKRSASSKHFLKLILYQ